MSTKKYAIGIDFGTLSGRVVIVDVAAGREIASTVHWYANGVIDEVLPGTNPPRPGLALQDPNDYLEVLKNAVPAALKESGVDPVDVIGLGIDFTACTMMPTKADGRRSASCRNGATTPTPGSNCGNTTLPSRKRTS